MIITLFDMSFANNDYFIREFSTDSNTAQP